MVDITTRVLRNARTKGVTVYTRKQWGSQHLALYQWRRKNRHHALLPGKPSDTMWQHITVTHDTGRGPRAFKRDMRTLERIGMERFGSGVSYNWVIDAQTGEIGLGQSLDAAGTHTINNKKIPGYSYNQNYVSLAVSVLGMPGAKLSEKAGNALVNLLKAHIEEGALTNGFDYNPHRMVAWKDCPTDNIVNVMPGIYRSVHQKNAQVTESVAQTEEATVEVVSGAKKDSLPILNKEIRRVRRLKRLRRLKVLLDIRRLWNKIN